MGNLVVVAIPAQDERVWKVSSEKVPHLTLLFLGDADSNPNTERIVEFVDHAVTVCEHGPFMLDVDYRGELGVDKADVLFFKKGWSTKWIEQFRNSLLQNTDIRTAYESTEQFPEWNPHLTLGYPETPANADDHEHGIRWVDFDRIAVWTGDFDGPEFRLEWPEMDYGGTVAYGGTTRIGMEFLTHHGIKGMHWGQRKSRPLPVALQPKANSIVPRGDKKKTKIQTEGGQNHPAHEDALKVAEARIKLHKSGPAALSNKELRDVATRLELENRVSQLNSSGSKKFVQQLLKQQGQQQIQKGISNQINKGGKKK